VKLRKEGELLPDDLLWVPNLEDKDRVQVIPGQLRTHDVAVGRHVAISAPAVPRFLDCFKEVYTATLARRKPSSPPRITVLSGFPLSPTAMAARPGSCRTPRCWKSSTQALCGQSPAAFARNVDDYRAHLAACDATRRNDLDGRGHLSEENLAEFTCFPRQLRLIRHSARCRSSAILYPPLSEVHQNASSLALDYRPVASRSLPRKNLS